MKIIDFEIFHADAGRSFSFLKVVTNSEIVGWSEFTGISEILRRRGLTAVIESLLNPLVGRDPRHIESCLLYTSPSPRDRQKSRMPSSA